MKVFISADIEGINGVTHWDETIKNKPDFKEFAHQMTLEVNAACKGAINAGAKEIWIKDAHDSGRNIDHNLLPQNTKLIRGWSGDLFSMVQELDQSFHALLFIGYHSGGGSNLNPLSHTMNTKIDYIKLNNEYFTEFLLHSYIAAYLEVPIVFLSGDQGLCEYVQHINQSIVTVAVKQGVGNSTINIHPKLAQELIETGVEKALRGNVKQCKLSLPGNFLLEIRYKEHTDAFAKSKYSGAKLIESKKIQYESQDYMEILQAIKFLA